jgi:hypothetical protein
MCETSVEPDRLCARMKTYRYFRGESVRFTRQAVRSAIETGALAILARLPIPPHVHYQGPRLHRSAEGFELIRVVSIANCFLQGTANDALSTATIYLWTIPAYFRSALTRHLT